MILFTKENWELSEYEDWISADIEQLMKFKMQTHTIDSLKHGIPEAAAPFLHFHSNCGILELEVLDKNLLIFGGDGSGNPLVINCADNDSISLLDHDNNLTEIYVNKSMSDFLSSLLIFRKYHKSSTIHLKEELQKVDSDLLQYSTFWKQQVNI